MKEDIKTILYMGLGALSETNEKIKELGDTLYEEGKHLYEKGIIANEELKHNISEMMKTSENTDCRKCSKEEIIKNLNKLSENEKRDIMNKMGWTDAKNEKGEQNN